MSEESTLDKFVDDVAVSDTSEGHLMTSLDETSVGDIPADWSVARLGELTEETLYGANESAEEYDPKHPRYIRIKDIDERGYLKESEKASLSPEKAEGYLLEKGDMLFARSGSPGRTYLHRQESGEYCYGGYSIKHKLVSKDLNHEFLSQYTKSQKYWDWIERIARTGAQANINSGEYASLLVPLPSLPEQRKIATVLYTVDQAIEKIEEVVEQLETVRRGTEQTLLSKGILQDGALRDEEQIEYKNSWVGEVPKDWDLQRYDELISDSSVGIVVKPSQYYDDTGEIPILRSKDISRDGIVSGDFEYMTHESNEGNSNSRLETGDVITVRSGEPGLSCVVSQEFDGANCADLLISTPGENLDPHYAAMWINSRAGRKQIDRFQAGLAQKHFNLGALRKMRFAVPTIEEQQRIVEKVATVTNSLDREKRYTSHLYRLKKGLLQDLLSGTVRTTDTNIEVPDEIAQHG